MSNLSNNQGRAYEFVCLNQLHSFIKQYRKVEIVHNSSLTAAQKAYNTLTNQQKNTYQISAQAILNTIVELEPRIIEPDDNILQLFLQTDQNGEIGDVRDIIILRENIKWEIGLSIKHNNFAVKHSRLSPTIDFGQKWFDIPCSQNYWNEVKPVFDYLQKEKIKNKKFSEILNKDIKIYKPIITAFINEIKRQAIKHKNIPQKMVEYLLSKYDFYKVISIDNQKLTQLQTYNIHNTLNKSATKQKPKILVPVASLPKRIISIDFAPNRNNTAELFMDNGWTFTFRIHNADTFATPTLKFDIQIKGMPIEILTFNCTWK